MSAEPIMPGGPDLLERDRGAGPADEGGGAGQVGRAGADDGPQRGAARRGGRGRHLRHVQGERRPVPQGQV